MDILFARHGNTFGPSDKVVWVGRETDLPLVDKGWQQARAFSQAVRRLNLLPDRIFCASLQRTRGFARTVVEELARTEQGVPEPVIDPRLDEIHYGRWAGLTSEEIAASDGTAQAQLDAWSAHDTWPHGAGWVTRESELQDAIQGFVQEVINTARPDERLLVVSSNGILRFLPRALAATDPGRPSYVMKTGHAGLISGTPGAFTLRFWNRAPDGIGGRH